MQQLLRGPDLLPLHEQRSIEADVEWLQLCRAATRHLDEVKVDRRSSRVDGRSEVCVVAVEDERGRAGVCHGLHDVAEVEHHDAFVHPARPCSRA